MIAQALRCYENCFALFWSKLGHNFQGGAMFTNPSREEQWVVALALLTIFLAPPSAAATLTRAWVSRTGANGSACGSATAPCRTLQYAHDAIVGPGGVIAVLDSGEFGPLVITKSVSIINDGAGTAIVSASGQDAVTINAAGTDKVVLRGLTIEGAGGGASGVVLLAGSSLSIEKCAVRNFRYSGIALAPKTAATIKVADTTVDNNGYHGIYLQPTGNVIDVHAYIIRVDVSNSGLNGIGVYSNRVGGASNVWATVTDTVSINNSGSGFYAIGSAVWAHMAIVRSTASGNVGPGALNAGNASMEMSGNAFVLQKSIFPWSFTSLGGLGRMDSYGDNLTFGGAVKNYFTLDKK